MLPAAGGQLLYHGASGNYPPSRSYQIQLPDQTAFQNRAVSTAQRLPVPAHWTKSGLLFHWAAQGEAAVVRSEWTVARATLSRRRPGSGRRRYLFRLAN